MIDENAVIQEIVADIKRTETVDFNAYAGHSLSHPVVVAFMNGEAEKAYGVLRQVLGEEYSAYANRIAFVSFSDDGRWSEKPGVKDGYTLQSLVDMQEDDVDLNRVLLFTVDDTSGVGDLEKAKRNLDCVKTALAEKLPGVAFVSWFSLLADSGAPLTGAYAGQCQQDPASFADGGVFIIENKLGNGAVYNKATMGWDPMYRVLACIMQLILDFGDGVSGNAAHIVRFVEERKPYGSMALGTAAAFARNAANGLNETAGTSAYTYESFLSDFGFSAGRNEFLLSRLNDRISVPDDEAFRLFPSADTNEPPANDGSIGFIKGFNAHTQGAYFAYIEALFDNAFAEELLAAYRDHLRGEFSIQKINLIRNDKNRSANVQRLIQEAQESNLLKSTLQNYARDRICQKYTVWVCEQLESLIEELYTAAQAYQNELNSLLTRILSKPRNDTANYFYNKALTQSGDLSAVSRVADPVTNFLAPIRRYVAGDTIFTLSYEDLLRELSHDERAQATSIQNKIMSDDNLMNRFYNTIGAFYSARGHFSGVTLFCNAESKMGKLLESDFSAHGIAYRICSTTSVSGICALRVFTYNGGEMG